MCSCSIGRSLGSKPFGCIASHHLLNLRTKYRQCRPSLVADIPHGSSVHGSKSAFPFDWTEKLEARLHRSQIAIGLSASFCLCKAAGSTNSNKIRLLSHERSLFESCAFAPTVVLRLVHKLVTVTYPAVQPESDFVRGRENRNLEILCPDV